MRKLSFMTDYRKVGEDKGKYINEPINYCYLLRLIWWVIFSMPIGLVDMKLAWICSDDRTNLRLFWYCLVFHDRGFLCIWGTRSRLPAIATCMVCIKNNCWRLGVVAHIFHPRTREQEQGEVCEFETSLMYIISSRQGCMVRACLKYCCCLWTTVLYNMSLQMGTLIIY